MNQKVIPGVQPVKTYQVNFDKLVKDKKRQDHIMVQAENETQAKLLAKDKLKGMKEPYKINSAQLWSAEEA